MCVCFSGGGHHVAGLAKEQTLRVAARGRELGQYGHSCCAADAVPDRHAAKCTVAAPAPLSRSSHARGHRHGHVGRVLSGRRPDQHAAAHQGPPGERRERRRLAGLTGSYSSCIIHYNCCITRVTIYVQACGYLPKKGEDLKKYSRTNLKYAQLYSCVHSCVHRVEYHVCTRIINILPIYCGVSNFVLAAVIVDMRSMSKV